MLRMRLCHPRTPGRSRLPLLIGSFSWEVDSSSKAASRITSPQASSAPRLMFLLAGLVEEREGRWVLTTSRGRAGASVTIRHESLSGVITGAPNAGRTEMVAPCRFSTYERPD